MVILYTVQSDEFINISDLDKIQDIDYVYVNITNRCPCSCTFCIRNNSSANNENSLWLQQEPSIEQIIDEFKKININYCKEIIFCGFGEPLERLDAVIQVSKYLKSKSPRIKIRVNTNGLGNLIHNKDITPMLKDLIDTISISLNASSKEKYLKLTNSKFGIKSFDSMLMFAQKCKNFIPNVTLSVVNVIDREEINKCEKLCEEISIPLRIRNYIYKHN